MLKNYFKIAVRNLSQHKSYTVINILGLSVALACCILISLYAKEELSFDRFHANADRIIAVGSDGEFFGKSLSTPYPLAGALEDEIPSIKKVVRLDGTGKLKLSVNGQDFVTIEQGSYTEPDFFNIFSFDLIRGNTAQALSAPNSIVLTREVSHQLFGDENPVGASLYWQKRDTTKRLQVTGVTQNTPRNSSIAFGALLSFNTMDKNRLDSSAWTWYSFETYALLKSKNAITSIPDQLDKLAKAHYQKQDVPNNSFFAIPLTQLHLSEVSNNDGFTGNSNYLYLFGSVALFILLIACVNYVNLATARTSIRSREVGVRKTLGAQRGQIAGQFLGESVLLTVISYILGVAISSLALPYFNQLFGTSVNWTANYPFLGWLLLAAVGVGLLAGLYPAVYLSKFSPLQVLRRKIKQGPSGSWLRKSLVVSQFAIAMALIISALVVYEQLSYTQTKDLGFDGQQVAAIQLPNTRSWRLRDQIRTTLVNHPGIQEVSISTAVPSEFGIRIGREPQKISPEEHAEADDPIIFAPAVVDYDYLNLLDIKLLAGRNFSPDLKTDQEQAVIINKMAARKLGWTPKEAIGKPFNFDIDGKIIGVTENFHIASFKKEIVPVMLQINESSSWARGGNLLARLKPDKIPASMDFIEKQLRQYAPNMTFNYNFLDEKFDSMYRTERRLAEIISLFTFVAIVIACLGLYGLSAFSVERRVKEIGIRKVLGATVTQVVGMLSKDFLKLVILGFTIAIPIAWYSMDRWLQDFAYRIDLGAGVFVLAGMSAVLIAVVTVSWQSLRAALANPVESLQSE